MLKSIFGFVFFFWIPFALLGLVCLFTGMNYFDLLKLIWITCYNWYSFIFHWIINNWSEIQHWCFCHMVGNC